jgi:hypothetical protein
MVLLMFEVMDEDNTRHPIPNFRERSLLNFMQPELYEISLPNNRDRNDVLMIFLLL